MTRSDRPSFWQELRRRRVIRAVTVYALTAWVAVQVADVFFPALYLPDWTITLVAVLAVLGFPVTVALAWVLDRTPQGFRKTDKAGDGEAAGDQSATSWRTPRLTRQFTIAILMGAALGVAVVGAGFWLTNFLIGDRTGETVAGNQVIAVLPFETIGEANPVFTEGIHGDVLTRLSGVPNLDVIARSSVMRYQDRSLPGLEIARELGVGWLLQGEVQQVTDQVQVNARLVEVGRDRQVWADAFRRELTAANLFEIQREITLEIFRALQDRFSGDETLPARPAATENLAAYRLYVQGRNLLGTRQEMPMRRAAEFFRQATEQDPSYAAAWAGLADALTYLETFGYPVPAGLPGADRAARRALELDPKSAEAHFALSNLAHARRDNRESIERLEHAIELRPSYADAFSLLSWIQKLHGQTEEGHQSALRAVALDPLGAEPVSNLILAHLAMGDAGQALAESRNLRQLQPDFATGFFFEALALYHQGRYAEARPLLENLKVAWAESGPEATLALVDLALGNATAARETMAGTDLAEHPFSATLVLAAINETSVSIDRFIQIENWDYWSTLALRYFFPEILGPLRRDERYEELLRQIDASWGMGTDGTNTHAVAANGR